MSDGYDWRHGWVPLTMRAALQKTRGNREAAAELLGQARERRRSKRAARGAVEFRPPTPAHLARAAWSGKTDDDLAGELATADERTAARIVAELDRRDAADRAVAAKRAKRAAARAARDESRDRKFDELLAAGTDATAAYAQAYGVTEERVRRDEAITAMRSSGYRGKGFDELVRHAFRDHAAEVYLAAEDETRGAMLSKEGQARGINPRDLFTGPEATARKYASPELLDYWQANGRLTVDDFRAGVLGGAMRSAGTAAWA